jgi:hypothetical protein
MSLGFNAISDAPISSLTGGGHGHTVGGQAAYAGKRQTPLILYDQENLSVLQKQAWLRERFVALRVRQERQRDERLREFKRHSDMVRATLLATLLSEV